MLDKLNIKTINYGSEEYEIVLDLRNEVFRKPQGLNIRDEDLSREEFNKMFIAYLDGEIVATTFLQEIDPLTTRIKVVMTLEKYRGAGIGSYMVQYAENQARENGYQVIKQLSRLSVVPFYEKMGYILENENVRDYYGVDHIDMIKIL